jgi:predicted nucleic acid-binding protein
VEIERRLVVDANILIRAVLGRRVRQIILDHADRVAFFAPEVAFMDARRYLPTLLEKRAVDAAAVAEALLLLEGLETVVHPVGEDGSAAHRATAMARIAARDEDDWPILATALALDCPIWTEDQDFFDTGVPTWTSDRIGLFLAEHH